MAIGAALHAWMARQWQKRGLWAYLTWPLAWLYGQRVKRSSAAFASGQKPVYRPAVPVIVIGNIYVGGTGKTPVTIAIARILLELGFKPGLVSRGYGRKPSPAPATGCGPSLDWQNYGDEPALIARQTGIPISVHANRGLAAEHLLKAFPEVNVILSDDGLQHHRLARDFEILIQDERGVGNGWLLPAGPLREPPTRVEEVDLVLTRRGAQDLRMSPDNAFSVELSQWRHAATGKTQRPGQLASDPLLVEPVIAAAAIGVPKRFFDSIRAMGIRLAATFALPDHQSMNATWLEQRNAGTILVTDKDAIKWSATPHGQCDPRVWIGETTVRWWSDDIGAFFERKLAQAGIKRPR